MRRVLKTVFVAMDVRRNRRRRRPALGGLDSRRQARRGRSGTDGSDGEPNPKPFLFPSPTSRFPRPRSRHCRQLFSRPLPALRVCNGYHDNPLLADLDPDCAIKTPWVLHSRIDSDTLAVLNPVRCGPDDFAVGRYRVRGVRKPRSPAAATAAESTSLAFIPLPIHDKLKPNIGKSFRSVVAEANTVPRIVRRKRIIWEWLGCNGARCPGGTSAGCRCHKNEQYKNEPVKHCRLTMSLVL